MTYTKVEIFDSAMQMLKFVGQKPQTSKDLYRVIKDKPMISLCFKKLIAMGMAIRKRKIVNRASGGKAPKVNIGECYIYFMRWDLEKAKQLNNEIVWGMRKP